MSLFELGEQFRVAPSLRPKLTIPSCNRTTQALSGASKAASRRQKDKEAIRARMQHHTYACNDTVGVNQREDPIES